MGRFVFITQQRSGTLMLWSMLREHPQLYLGSRESFAKTLAGYWKAVESKWPDAKAHGAHFHFVGFGYQQIRDQLAEAVKGCRVVWLTRENRLATYISYCISTERRQVVAYREKDVGGPFCMVVDIGKFEAYCDRETTHQRLARDFFCHSPAELNLTYLDVTDRTQVTLQKVCEFIGVDYVPAQPQTLRLRRSPIRDCIENLAEIESYLIDIGKSRWLDE